MRHLLSILLSLSAATPLSATDLQMVKARSGLVMSWHDQQMAMLAPSLRDWVSVRSRAMLDSGEEPDAGAIARDVNARLAGQDFSAADVEALVQLVMMESARQADADLRDMMEQMRVANERKARMREMANSQREQSRAVSDQARAEYAERQALPNCAEPPCLPQVPIVKPQAPIVQPQVAIVQPQLAIRKPVARQPPADVDSLSGQGEMASMRLQMNLDRRAKFIETLSNLMKKHSDTASTITSNLK